MTPEKKKVLTPLKKIDQFCVLFSLQKLYQVWEMLSTKSFFTFGYTWSFVLLCVENIQGGRDHPWWCSNLSHLFILKGISQWGSATWLSAQIPELTQSQTNMQTYYCVNIRNNLHRKRKFSTTIHYLCISVWYSDSQQQEDMMEDTARFIRLCEYWVHLLCKNWLTKYYTS